MTAGAPVEQQTAPAMPLNATRRGLLHRGMRGPDAAVLGDSLIYLVGAALIGAGNFILLPLYTRSLDAARFGAYSLLDVSILIVVTIAQLGLGITYLKWFADLDPARHGELLGLATATALVTGALGGGALLIGAWRSSALAMADSSIPWLLLLIAPIETIQGVWLADLRARRRSVLFCAAAACRLFIMVGASWWFVQAQRQGIRGILL